MIEIKPGIIDREIEVPTSKSYSNRLLILGALVKEPLHLFNCSNATDVVFLKQCLEQIGVIINDDTVVNSFPECEPLGEEVIEIKSGDGGTTNRFLLALLCLGKRSYRVFPDQDFLKRPIAAYLDLLKGFGAFVKHSDDFIEIKGPITIPENYSFKQMGSSQFVSAIKMIKWKKEFDSSLVSNSKKYIELTEHLISQVRQGQREFTVPIDFGAVSYPLILAVISGSRVLIKNCKETDLLQADAEILAISKRAGVQWQWGDVGLEILKSNKLQAFEADARICPDLIPGLACLASRCDGTTLFHNVDLLRGKESDRLIELQKLLDLFEIKYRVKENTLHVDGKEKKSSPVVYNAPKDHRMIMTASLFMKNNSGGVIHNAQWVDKSFPGFFDTI